MMRLSERVWSWCWEKGNFSLWKDTIVCTWWHANWIKTYHTWWFI
jgi:hypothetical protein